MSPVDLRKAVVLGAGTMGHGIAQVLAECGVPVSLWARDASKARSALDRIESNLRLLVRYGQFAESDIPRVVGCVEATDSLEQAAAGADLAIEAVAEDLALKQGLFAQLGELCAPNAVLGSNTSSLPINSIAAPLADGVAARLLAMHFWNPAPIMPLVEVVPNRRTSPEYVEQALQIVRFIGKEPTLLHADVPGYIGNRLQIALLREAVSIVERGIASAEDVDRAMRLGLGLRLARTGPLETADLAGLDLFLAVTDSVLKDLDHEPSAPALLREKVAHGELGAKSGRGFYDWTPEQVQQCLTERDLELIWRRAWGFKPPPGPPPPRDLPHVDGRDTNLEQVDHYQLEPNDA